MTTMPTTVQERFTLPVSYTSMGGEGGGAPTAGDIAGMIRRRMVLIVVLFLLFSGLAVGGFLAWRTYFPGYRSECLIECISNIPETELTIDQERLKQEEHERFVLSQALLLESPTILSEVLKVNAVRETAWYRSVKNNEHLLALTDAITAAPVRGTNFLRVSMEYGNRHDPAVIVNEVVRQWHDAVRRRAAEDFALRALQDAEEEERKLDKAIEEKRGELKRMSMRLPAGAPLNPANNITAQQVSQYGEQVAKLTLELSQLEQYRTIYNDPQGVAVTAEDRALVEQDPQVGELARMVFLLQQQLAADERNLGTGHRSVRQLKLQLGAGEEKLAALRAVKLRERRNDIRDATNTAYANTQHSLFLAQENLARAEAELQDQDQLLFSYNALTSEIEQETTYKLKLSDYVKSRSRVIRQQTAVRVNIAQPAIEPLEKSSPSFLLLPVGIFLAMLMSVGLALGIEVLDKSVRTSQDISRYLDIGMLGAVPDTDDEEVAIKQVETAVRDAPRSMVAEAFRRIRTNLQYSAPAERQRSLLVTSPRPDDGKTTIACNLAIAIAQGGRHVLLIDANFRRPQVHRLFGTTHALGLSNVLVVERTMEECIVQTATPLLDVLGSGPVPPNPAELLGGDACRALLKQATVKYDQVIIDAAPVLLSSDALIMSTAVDGVILVVRAKASSRGVARRASGLLTNVGARLFGAILNAAQVRRGGYFREQLRDYYDYQADDAHTAAQSIAPRRSRPS